MRLSINMWSGKTGLIKEIKKVIDVSDLELLIKNIEEKNKGVE
jgi:hypothetical protein